MKPRTQTLAVIAAALAIVSVRAWALLDATRFPFWTRGRLDNLVYEHAARRMLEGDLLLGREVLHMSPGYTAFLAVVFGLFGSGPWAWRLAQTALGLGAVLATADAARTLAGKTWAFGVALVMGLYGPLIFYEAQMLPEALQTCLNATLLALVARSMRAPVDEDSPRRWKRYALTGLVWGASVLVRPNELLLAAPIAFGLAQTVTAWRDRAKVVGVFALAGALMIAPVTVRNRAVAGEWVMVTDSGGLNFFIGNGPGSLGVFRIPREVPGGTNADTQFPAFRAVAERDRGRSLTSREVDAYWFDRTWRFIKRRPRRWALLLIEKTWLFWSAREVPNTEDYSFNRQINGALALPLVQFATISPFALAGTLLWLTRRRGAERVVAAINLTIMAALVGFFVLAHYRVPAVPGLALAAMGCVQALVSWASKRSWPKLAVALAALAATLPVVFTAKVPKPFDDEWFKLGVAWHYTDRLDEAADCYRRALAIEPKNVSARKNLAILLDSRGQLADAEREWRLLLATARERHLPDYEREALAHLPPGS